MSAGLWIIVVGIVIVGAAVVLRSRSTSGRHRASTIAAGPAEERGIEPLTEPAAEPVTEPVTEPAAEPVTEPVTEPVIQPAPEPAPELISAPPLVLEPEPELGPEPGLQPEPDLHAEPELGPEPDLQPEPQPQPEPELLVQPPRSAPPGADGSGPAGWRVKGNADSLLYYPDDAPVFPRVRADVWFPDEDAAVAAGFVRWDAHRR